MITVIFCWFLRIFNKNNLQEVCTSSFLISPPLTFLYFIALARTFRKMLIELVSRHLCLVLGHKRSGLPLRMMLAEGILQTLFIRLRKFLSNSEIYTSSTDAEFCQMFFSVSIDIIIFSPYSVNRLYLFLNIKPILYSWDKTHLVMLY